jgi:hypothetical protein
LLNYFNFVICHALSVSKSMCLFLKSLSNKMWLMITTNIFIITNICVLVISLPAFPINIYNPYTILKPIRTSKYLLKERLYNHLEKIHDNIKLMHTYFFTVNNKIVNDLTDILGLFGLFSDIKATVKI